MPSESLGGHLSHTLGYIRSLNERMIELDFLFLYEHKVRELENLCLMKYELDKRGYKTRILFINDAANSLSAKCLYHTKVLCTMACYHNATLRWHVKEYIKFDKIIDLQWENIVYPKDEKREGAYKNYLEVGRNVVHVSWGRQNQKRLVETAHLDPKKVKMVGHVGMDFLRAPLNRYYISREELFEIYQIPQEKKIILFASPYYRDDLTQEYINDMCSRFGKNWTEYYEFMCKSQRIVLEWFEQICQKNKDMYIVFRPHPGHPSKMAQELEKKYNNFKIIGGESVKQWIVACDKVYTGNSSVVVEAFFARKDCQLLFPLPTTEGFELKLIADSKHIKTYEEFEKTVLAGSNDFPTPQESIEEIYIVDWEVPSYIRFADMAEEVLKDDYYKLTREQLCNYQGYTPIMKLVKALCRIDFLYNVYLWMLSNEKLQLGFLKRQRRIRKTIRDSAYEAEKADAHELTSEEEIQSIISRIDYALKMS